MGSCRHAAVAAALLCAVVAASGAGAASAEPVIVIRPSPEAATAAPKPGGDRVAASLNATSAQLARARTAMESGSHTGFDRLHALHRTLERRKFTLLDQAQVTVRDDLLDPTAADGADSAEVLAFTPTEPAPAQVIPSPAPISLPDPASLGPALDAYLATKGSPLVGLGQTFVAEASAVGLDPRLLVAIAGSETGFGTYGPSQLIHNPFGMGPGIEYPTWADAIGAAARNLAGDLYLGAGKVTIAQISQTWAPVGAANDPSNLNVNWTTVVGRLYAELGGDPNGSVFAGAAAPYGWALAAGMQAGLAAPVATGAAEPVTGTTPALRQAATEMALAYLGMPYLWGGTSPETGFDCSGLVQFVYGQQGVQIPRVAEDQAR
ncbi:MAG: peptidoglycan DL-endopeptidase CwlO, partial [Miltoncostaeaceae bacterium]|nr:peptidoglycan DL-endopeptidase CwlO [Miltoncostaeaceae bacterium]